MNDRSNNPKFTGSSMLDNNSAASRQSILNLYSCLIIPQPSLCYLYLSIVCLLRTAPFVALVVPLDDGGVALFLPQFGVPLAAGGQKLGEVWSRSGSILYKRHIMCSRHSTLLAFLSQPHWVGGDNFPRILRTHLHVDTDLKSIDLSK